MMPHKKLIGSIILLFFIALCFIPNIQANPSIIISDYSLEPEIFHPGDSGILTITITNAETSSTKTDTDYINSLPVDQTIETVGAVIENIYISSDSDGSNRVKATDNYEDIIEIAPGSSFSVQFPIIAEENITEGTYLPIVHVDLESDNFQDVSYPIVVKVSNDSVDFISSNFPSSIPIIGGTDISFSVINNRENEISNIYITPIENELIKFSPTKNFISTISGNSKEDVTISFIPKQLGSENVTFQCSYKNGDNQHSEVFTFPISIDDSSDVYPIIYHMPTTMQQGQSDQIRLKIYNAKNEEISGVVITPTTDVKLTPNEYFIGSMDPDDIFAVTFDLSTDDLQVNHTYPIDFIISFKQDNQYYQTSPISASIEITKSNGSSGMEIAIGAGVLLVIIIIVFFFMFYRRRRGKK